VAIRPVDLAQPLPLEEPLQEGGELKKVFGRILQTIRQNNLFTEISDVPRTWAATVQETNRTKSLNLFQKACQADSSDPKRPGEEYDLGLEQQIAGDKRVFEESLLHTDLKSEKEIRLWMVSNLPILKKIIKLDLSYLKLHNLPSELELLSELTDLNLAHNELSCLRDILPKLERLHAAHNKIERLQQDLFASGRVTFPALSVLDLRHNPLREISDVPEARNLIRRAALQADYREGAASRIALFCKIKFSAFGIKEAFLFHLSVLVISSTVIALVSALICLVLVFTGVITFPVLGVTVFLMVVMVVAINIFLFIINTFSLLIEKAAKYQMHLQEERIFITPPIIP